MALDEPNNWISLFLGFLLTALGILPMLNGIGVIPFGLPSFMSGFWGSIISLIVFAGVGAYLLIDSFFEDDAIFWITFVMSIIILLVGVLGILGNFGVLAIAVPQLALIYQLIFLIEGILLIIAAFAMN
ncbi:hypothetical protein C0585_07230 [Candidatus Woesearchaeota archaeon]|nr:MAG: hypothetical protein C0585_07230 [Candidatus Woesearchaeota archaeon]